MGMSCGTSFLCFFITHCQVEGPGNFKRDSEMGFKYFSAVFIFRVQFKWDKKVLVNCSEDMDFRLIRGLNKCIG